MNPRFRKWFFLAPFLFAGFVLLLGWVVMLLWNAILVPAAGAGVLNLWQGIGLLVLSRILVGGFRGRGGWSGKRAAMKEKWMNMTPEEKIRFKQACRSRWSGETVAPETGAQKASE